MGNAAGKLNGSSRWVYMLVLAIPFYGWVVLEALQPLESGLAYIGWAVLFGFFAYATGIRFQMREEFGIIGNMGEDFFAVMLMYPFAAMQMEEQMLIVEAETKDVEEGDNKFSLERVGEPNDNDGMYKRRRHDESQATFVTTMWTVVVVFGALIQHCWLFFFFLLTRFGLRWLDKFQDVIYYCFK